VFGVWFFCFGGKSTAQLAGPEIILYTGEDFTGESVRVTDTLLDLPKGVEDGPEEFRWNWNDNIKSIEVVRGTWRLYEHGRLNTTLDDTPVEELTAEAARAKGAVEGWSCLVSGNSERAVQYPTPTSGPWASSISSVELVSEENLPDWAIH
jgi:hypothetical protein